jgi:hypothetical protein
MDEMSRKELFFWVIAYVLIMPIALDFMRGVYVGLGWIK